VLAEGHWSRANAPIPARDRPMLAIGALVAAALVVVALAASIADSHPQASSGCKRVTVAMSTGGATIERCDPR
jgi:hypothetical protein